MKIFDSRKSIVLASIGVLFATLALVSCEKREEPLLNEIGKYSKVISFNQVEKTTRSVYTDINNQLPNATYVLQTELGDTLYLQEYVSDIDEEWMTRATEFETKDLTVFDILAYNVKADGTLEVNTDLCKKVDKNDDGTWSYGAFDTQDEINWSALGDNNVKFVAYANLPDNTTENIVVTPISQTEFKLNLPTESAKQKDIVVAKGAVKDANGVVTRDIFNSSFNTQVPLEFEHILAQVAFVVDENLAVPGTFTKAEIVDYPSNGAVYDIINNTWNMENAAKQTLTLFGNNITSNVFMVVPQEISGSTAFKFYFTPQSGTVPNQEFLVQLAGVKWKAGKKYTYKVSNSAVTLCNFVNIPEYVDAHYSIVEIDVASLNGCKILYDATGEVEPSVTFTKSLLDIQDPQNKNGGYWIKRGTGSGYQNRSTSLEIPAGQEKVYAHIVQNLGASGNLRELNIKLQPKVDNSYSVSHEIVEVINQFEPYWTAPGIGCERIEEVSAEMWGPYWVLKGENKKATVSYTLTGGDFVGVGIESIMNGQFWDLFSSYIELPSNILSLIMIWNWGKTGVVTFDYTSFLNNNSTQTTSGFDNTYNATSSTALGQVTAVQSLFSSRAQNKDGDATFEVVDYEKSAILSSQKKNAYTYTEMEGKMLPQLADGDKIWFCPSEHECCTLNVLKNEYIDGVKRFGNAETDLSDTYWTSNAVIYSTKEDPTEKYTAKTFTITNAKTGEGTIGEASRTNLYNIRACCKAPETQKSLNQVVE